MDFFAGRVAIQFHFCTLTHICQRVVAERAVYNSPLTQIMIMFPDTAVGKAGLEDSGYITVYDEIILYCLVYSSSFCGFNNLSLLSHYRKFMEMGIPKPKVPGISILSMYCCSQLPSAFPSGSARRVLKRRIRLQHIQVTAWQSNYPSDCRCL